MPYFTLNIGEKVEMSGFNSEAEARAYCRKHDYSIFIIFEGKFADVFEDRYRYGPPIAVYVHGQGYNTTPVVKDVPYTTYRVIQERLPKAENLDVIIVGDDTYSEVHDKIDASFDKGTRLLWVIYPDSRFIEVRTTDRKQYNILREHDIIDGGDIIPGFSIPVKDLLEEIVVE